MFHIQKKHIVHFVLKQCLLLFFMYCIPVWMCAQVKDSTHTLKKIIVTKDKGPNTFKNIIPAQVLNSNELEQINAQSVGDAASYFSGVLVKDYGGTGGFKVISVRGLGSTNTGIMYDGLIVSDMQSGQNDLSKFSGTFVQSIELYHAQPPLLLTPARAFASSSILAVNTNTFEKPDFSKVKWTAGLKAGSFGLWQPFAGIYSPIGKRSAFSAQAESVFSKGDYPFYIDNGNLSEKAKRNNSETKSLQGEINFIKQFSDSSIWQTKLWSFHSKRGLPGAVIFFNDNSVQKLWNNDVFIQSRYRKVFNEATSLLISAKYSNNFTRYTDPHFLNNAGGLDNKYTQDEIYGSVSVSQKIAPAVFAAFASDIAFTKLDANLENFVYPSRLSLWNNLSLKYLDRQWQLSGSLLYTTIHDKTKSPVATIDKNKLTPTIAVSFKPQPYSPLLLRFFYKEIFRMPVFNELYYTLIGNNKLRPEYASQYNAGISYSKSFDGNITGLSASVDAYYNKVKDKIVAVPNQNVFSWSMLNIGKVDIKGVDVNIDLKGKLSAVTNWFVRTAYTWQQALNMTDASSDSYKNRIPYTPDHSGSAIASLSYKEWSFGYNLLFSGNRYALGTNNYTNELTAWITNGVSVSHLFKLTKFAMLARAEADNITNERLEVVKNFPMPGRSFKISITFKNI